MDKKLKDALGNMPDAQQTNVNESMTSAGRLDKMLKSDSPLMKRAATQGKQQSQSRGLLNSSMSAGASQGAMIDRAQPFAMQDSNNLIQNAQRNTDAKNQYGLLQAGLIGDSYKSNQNYTQQLGLNEQAYGFESDLADQRQEYQKENMSLADQIQQGQMRLDNTLGQSDMKLSDRLQQTQMKLQNALNQGDMKLANELQKDLNAQQQEYQQSNMQLDDELQQKRMELQQALDQGNMQLANQLQRELNDQGYDHQRGLNSQNFDIQSALGDQSYLHDLGRASQGFQIQSALNDQGYIQNVGLIGAELGANQQMSQQEYNQQLGLNQQQGNIQQTLNQYDYNFRSNLSQQEFSQSLQRASQDFGFQSALAKQTFENGMSELYGSANANGWGVMANSVTDIMANSARRIDQIQMNPNISEADKEALISDVQSQTDNMVNTQQQLLGELGGFMESTGVFPEKVGSGGGSSTTPTGSGSGSASNQYANLSMNDKAQEYLNQNRDIREYYNANKDAIHGAIGGSTAADYAKWHYENRGRDEGRKFPGGYDGSGSASGSSNQNANNSTPNNTVTDYAKGEAPASSYEGTVNSLYSNILGREPGSGAMNHYAKKIQSGEMTVAQVRNELKNSPEAKISDLYQSILGRSPDQAGRDYYIQQLQNGASLQDIEYALKQSSEYRGR